MRDGFSGDIVLTDYAHKIIQFKARQLSRRYGFTSSDREDIEQELWTAVLGQVNAFDPQRASINTFIDCVVNSAIRMLLRDRRCLKRAEGFHAQSMNTSPEVTGSSFAINEPNTCDRCRHRGIEPINDTDREVVRESTEFALREMPKRLRDVCQLVMAGTIQSAARELGISRRQVRKALSEARPYLHRAGFGNS